MSAKTKTPGWVVRLRGSCPKGWSVKGVRGSIRLSVRKGAGGADGASKMLPIAWAADTVPEAVALITRLHHLVEDGVDLADALDREFGSVPAARSPWCDNPREVPDSLGARKQTWRHSLFVAICSILLGAIPL